MDLKDLKRAILDFKTDAEEGRDGEKIDLANVLWKIIHNFEHKGRDYVLKKYYWNE
jgi:hypothetical protein